MTINRLIKELQKLENKHGKRIPVFAAAKDMYEGSNKCFSHLAVSGLDAIFLEMCDDDGFHTGKEKFVVVLQ